MIHTVTLDDTLPNTIRALAAMSIMCPVEEWFILDQLVFVDLSGRIGEYGLVR